MPTDTELLNWIIEQLPKGISTVDYNVWFLNGIEQPNYPWPPQELSYEEWGKKVDSGEAVFKSLGTQIDIDIMVEASGTLYKPSFDLKEALINAYNNVKSEHNQE